MKRSELAQHGQTYKERVVVNDDFSFQAVLTEQSLASGRSYNLGYNFQITWEWLTGANDSSMTPQAS